MQLIRSLILASTLVFGLASSTAIAQNIVKVGAIYALTGGAGPQGTDVVRAIEVMADIINEDGGVLGKKIELVVGDHQSVPAVAVSRATEVVNQGVSVIIEGMGSPFTLAMQPIIARAGVLDITAASKSDTILTGGGNPYAILVNSSNLQDGALAAEYIIKNKKKRVAFLIQNDVYGNTGQTIISNELEKRNYQYERVAIEKFPYNQTDFRIPLTAIGNANPDVVIVLTGNLGAGLPAIIRQSRQLRIGGDFFTPGGLLVPSVVRIAGEAVNGWRAGTYYLPDVEPFVTNPINIRFKERLQEKFRISPDEYMAVGAAALQVWAKAATELGTFDRERIAKRIRGGSFKNTLLGDISFEQNGQLRTEQFVFIVRDGKYALDR